MRVVVFLLMLCFVLWACSFSDRVHLFIPGMYVRVIDHEFAKGHDTLIIRQLESTTYEIVKRSGVIPVRDGQQLAFRNSVEIWTAIYDSKDHVLYETRKGKIISFLPDENKLLVGTSAYQKIK